MSRDAHIKVVEDLKKSIRRNIEATWGSLQMETLPSQRALLKTRINMLASLLDQLEGKTQWELLDLSEEAASLREKLHEAKREQRDMASSLQTSRKIIKDLKTQLHRGNDEARRVIRDIRHDNQRLLDQVREIRMIVATKLDMQSAIIRNLSLKLQQAHNQLQQQQQAMQGAIQPQGDGMDLCGLWVQLQEKDHNEEEEEEEAARNKEASPENVTEKEQKNTIRLEKTLGTNLSERWDDNNETLSEICHKLMTLQTQLETRDQGVQQVLQKEQGCRRAEVVSQRKRKTGNWFVRMFKSGAKR